MATSLDGNDIAVLLESLEYSKQRVAEAQGTPYEVRKKNLDRLDRVAEKLRTIRAQK